MKTVGILGGGQLGWMLSESLFKYGGTPLILANKHSLAADRVPGTIVGSWSDPDTLKDFFDRCDIVTIEVEHVDVEALQPFADKMAPSLDVIRLAQHRIVEKQFLADNALPHAWTLPIQSQEDGWEYGAIVEFPLIAKTALGGYDGRGQYKIDDEDAYWATLDELGDAVDEFGIVLEEPLDLFAEASVILARGRDGSVAFPVFENDHRHHILDITHLPSALPTEVEDEMKRLATEAADSMGVHGMLTTEFFITRSPGRSGGVQVGDYYLFVNEFAPRPHNSGHVSRNACTLSQFDALARVLLDLPLTTPHALPGSWCMANLLSDLWDDAGRLDVAAGLDTAPAVVDVVLYGKEPTRPKRKMGHVVAHATSRDDAAGAAAAFRSHAQQSD